MSTLDIKREFYRVIRKPSKNVQRVINIEWKKIDLYQIKIGIVNKEVVGLGQILPDWDMTVR